MNKHLDNITSSPEAMTAAAKLLTRKAESGRELDVPTLARAFDAFVTVGRGEAQLLTHRAELQHSLTLVAAAFERALDMGRRRQRATLESSTWLIDDEIETVRRHVYHLLEVAGVKVNK